MTKNIKGELQMKPLKVILISKRKADSIAYNTKLISQKMKEQS
jgi:hypothetical protein